MNNKLISLFLTIVISTSFIGSYMINVSAEMNDSENAMKYRSFNELINMSDEEILSIYDSITGFSEFGFGDDSIDDEVKFKKMLNPEPHPSIGAGGGEYKTTAYGIHLLLVKGRNILPPTIVYTIDSEEEINEDLSASDLGYPDNWKLESFDAVRCVQSQFIVPIKKYRLYVPVDILLDFENYCRLRLAQNYAKSNINGYTSTHFLDDHLNLTGDGTVILKSEILKGDANCDKEVGLADALTILQYIVNRNKYPLTDHGWLNSDIVGDDDGVTLLDALEIQIWDSQKKLS